MCRAANLELQKVVFFLQNGEKSGEFIQSSLTLLLLNTTCPALANSVDPDQLASDLDLHGLS